MNGKSILKDLVDATYKPTRDLKDAVIEDFAVNLNPFLRPAHMFKALSYAGKGDELAALVHTIQSNPILPPLPTGLLDYLKSTGQIPEMPLGGEY